MVGQGCGRVKTRAAVPEPVKETIVGADQVTPILRDFLVSLEARLTVIEELLVRSTQPPSPEGPAVAQSEPGVVQQDMVVPGISSADRESWLRIIEGCLELVIMVDYSWYQCLTVTWDEFIRRFDR